MSKTKTILLWIAVAFTIIIVTKFIAAYIWHLLRVTLGVKWGDALFYVVFILCIAIWAMIKKSKSDVESELTHCLMEVVDSRIARDFINSLDGWLIQSDICTGIHIYSIYSSCHYFLTYKGKCPTKEQSKWLHRALITPAEQTYAGYRLINEGNSKHCISV